MKADRIIFATCNEGKMKEIRMILADMKLPIQSMKEADIHIDIEENGQSFEENALIKARAVATAAQQKGIQAVVLADDSGLEIDYLNKEPGVYSARYMGHDTSYDIKNQAIIDRLAGVEDKDRTARFVCAMAAVFPDGRHFTTRGTMEGIIAHEIKGANGFGYDPIVYLPQYGKTSAELTPEEKNKISHRGEALEKLKAQLAQYLN